MKELFDELGTCRIDENSAFRFLCGENLDELAKFFQSKTIKEGETVWKEGDPSGQVAIICSGHIEIKKETEFKGNNVVVASYSSGAVVGALGILDGRPRAATATAPEDISLLIITRENFETLIENNPAIGTKLLKGLLLSVSMRSRMSFERLVTFF